jgi:hypothetical protein
MAKDRIPTFEAFWPYYLGEHKNPLCRNLHFVGTTLALSLLVTALGMFTPAVKLTLDASGCGASHGHAVT